MKTNVTQQQVNSETKHVDWEIAVVLFFCYLSPLCLLVQRHFMACKWFCRLGFVVVDAINCVLIGFLRQMMSNGQWRLPPFLRRRSEYQFFTDPLDSMGKNPSLLLNEWWTKDFFSDTQSKGADHFMVGRSPCPLQLQIWGNDKVQKCFFIRLVWFVLVYLTPRKQRSNLFSDAASAAVSEQLSLHCTGASAPTPYPTSYQG